MMAEWEAVVLIGVYVVVVGGVALARAWPRMVRAWREAGRDPE